MEVSYATMEAMGMLIQLLGQDARRLEKALAKTMNASAEWKRIADELKAERDAAKQEAVSARQDAVTRAEADRKRIDGLMIQAQDMRAEIERLKKPRQHPVKVGESVRRTTEGSIAPIGTLGRVLVVWSDAYQVELRKGFSAMWAFDDCTPCDPPPEASHITPEGKQTAEGALPQPGDVVRLVRVPTVKDCSKYDFQDSEQLRLISTQVNTMGKVVGTELCDACACVVDDTGTIKAWPLSCIEVVKGGDK
jgi:hypothetical protein